MELSELYTREDHEAGAWVPIYGPDGKKTKLEILVMGKDSDVYRQDAREARRAVLNAMADGTIEELDEDARDIETLVKLSIDWRGTDQDFTREECRKLYREAPNVRDQIDAFIGNRANFIKG